MPNALVNMDTHRLENNYTYDADGRRIANGTYEFIYDLQGRPVTQFLSSNGVPSHERIYAGARHIASYSAATTNFLHTDWLGTRRVMTNVSGANSETCTGLPFGDSLSCTGTDWDFNHFTDDIHDSESNTEHTWFRQLSATQGRWMRPDPYLGSIDLANPQSLNRYAYVLNGPTLFTDPLGLATYCVEEGGHKTCETEDDEITEFIDLLFGHNGPSSGGGGNSSGGGASPAANSCAGPNPPVPCANAGGQTPVHGLWTYGNWCGAGGSGTPINGTDAACMAHDQCYAQNGLTPGSNFQGHNAELQICNQNLCNAVRAQRQSIISQAANSAEAMGLRTSRGVSPAYLPGQESEIEADSEINFYFTWIVAWSNSCRL